VIESQADELDVFQACRVESGPEHYSRLSTKMGENVRGPAQQFRNIPLKLLKRLPNEGSFFLLQLFEFHDAVEVEAQAPVRWHAPGRSVRLAEQPQILQVGHYIPNGCRADLQTITFGNCPRPNRLTALNIVVDHGFQNLLITLG